MESCFQDKSRTIRTNSYVLWNVYSPATFQGMMDSIFDDMITGTLIIVYMDDMFIFHKDLKILKDNMKIALK